MLVHVDTSFERESTRYSVSNKTLGRRIWEYYKRRQFKSLLQ
jgi:hypothetical protein